MKWLIVPPPGTQAEKQFVDGDELRYVGGSDAAIIETVTRKTVAVVPSGWLVKRWENLCPGCGILMMDKHKLCSRCGGPLTNCVECGTGSAYWVGAVCPKCHHDHSELAAKQGISR